MNSGYAKIEHTDNSKRLVLAFFHIEEIKKS